MHLPVTASVFLFLPANANTALLSSDVAPMKTLLDSDGVTLTDSTAANSICNASTYPGPFTRWQTIRRNAISGVALSAAELNKTSPPCGTITTANASTDVVVEHNTFSCPAGSTQPPIEAACSHCKVVA